MIKLTKILSTKQFVLSLLIILTVGLLFLAGVYYIVNIQYLGSDKPFESGPVTTPPKSLRLDLSEPDDDSLTFQSSIIISGKTGPAKEILISTDTQDLVIKSKPDGSFSTVINLMEGVNQITAVVFDISGDFRSVERTVYYSKEKI